ncbi:MAG TPA: GtrA family protein [Rhodanobacteraceae bacterium]|nr:GtrA family protein [Rhodanobacteraceae bacterium]
MGITRQGLLFLLVGGLLVFLDWAVFVVLTAVGVSAAPANVIGRVFGALLGFWLNGWVTFGDPGSPRHGRQRFARFATLWVVLTVLSTVLVTLLADRLSLHVAWLAKPIVEAFMAILSFVASRQWVYR